MSKQKHDDDCPGCRPVLIDVATGKVEPVDSSRMRIVMAVWGRTTRAEREAFHRFTCLNSRDPGDVAVMQAISLRFKQAIEAQGN